MTISQKISADFPFKSNYVEVHGSRIHYVDEGEGDPILFLHGNPTSSYLWRNIIPHLSSLGRCIAPDLIGMGKSDKPNIKYGFFDQVKYIQGFIEELGLDNITLVIHDWGSAIGFHYAMRHESKIKGIAFMEAQIKPMKWEDWPKGYEICFRYLFRNSVIGWILISVMNTFLTLILPQLILRKLSSEEKDHYKSPYKTIKSRKAVRQFPRDLPMDGEPKDVHEACSNYNQKLQQSELPKLLIYATPGSLITSKDVDWCKENLKNLKTVDFGEGLHYIQEDNPHLIGAELAKWYQEL
jgi:haloalkane dehalogenase